MKIIQDLELNSFRFTAQIESKTLETHSKMQSLTEIQIESIKSHLKYILERLARELK